MGKTRNSPGSDARGADSGGALRIDQVDRDRMDTLTDIIESDRAGVRLDRFVMSEREELAACLAADEFTLTLPDGVQWDGLFERVQRYDAVTLPYIDFFATGCAYTNPNHGQAWAEFVQRIATCNQPTGGGYVVPLRSLTFYPALLLLYGAGLVCTAKGRLRNLRTALSVGVQDHYGQRTPVILRMDSFDVMEEQGQKAIPEIGRQFTPLINHIFSSLALPLRQYFPTESLYTQGWVAFETLLLTAYTHAERERDALLGSPSEKYWIPWSRLAWMDRGHGEVLKPIASDARRLGADWPPLAAGFFSGNVDTFVRMLEAVQASFSHVRLR
jgi:hypothetical protein